MQLWKVKNANEGVDTAAGQDDVWTLDLFSVLKRRVSCRVLTRINTWEINWNNQFSAGIKARLHKEKIYNPQVGQDSVFFSSRLSYLRFVSDSVVVWTTPLCRLPEEVAPSFVFRLWPLTFGLLPVGWCSFCCKWLWIHTFFYFVAKRGKKVFFAGKKFICKAFFVMFV